MKRWLWVLPLLLLASPIFSAPSLFDVPLQDQSRVYLQQLFGAVGDFMAGASLGYNPLKDALALFNNCALVLGGVVILYSLVVSTLNTANDGEMLGKKWNSVWIPIRSALGFGLLLPTTSGYSIIQVFVMWVVVQGIGAADYVWSNYATKMAEGTYTTTVNTTYSGAGSSTSLNTPANNIFSNLVCAHSAQMIAGTTGQVFVDTGSQYVFSTDGSSNPTCGTLNKASDPQVNGYLENFVEQIDTNSALPFAKGQYALQFPTPGVTPTQPSTESIQNGIQTAMQQYSANISQLSQDTANQNAQQQGGQYGYYSTVIQNQIGEGWLYAGSMYMTILRLQTTSPLASKSGQQTSKNVATSAYPQVTPYNEANIHLGQSQAQFVTIMNNADSLTSSANYASLDPNSGSTNLNCASMVSNTRADKALGGIQDLCNQVTGSWGDVLKKQHSMTGSGNVTSTYSPIISLAQWGQSAVNAVAWTWISMFALITAGAIAGIVISFMFPGPGEVAATTVGALMAYMAPIFFMVMSFYLTEGALAGYYIPVLPFMIYMLTSIGWFFLVIEAMVAAPLLALGILHPEGQHDIFGHASSGFMILVGIFLRPVLIVIGFIAATLFVNVAIQMVNTGFYEAIFNLFSAGTSHNLTVWASLIMTMMYVTTLFTVVNRSFTLIYIIPDKVLRWIGVNESSGVEGDVQALKGGFDQRVKGVGDLSNQTGEGITQAGSTSAALAQKKGKEKKEKAAAGGGGP